LLNPCTYNSTWLTEANLRRDLQFQRLDKSWRKILRTGPVSGVGRETLLAVSSCSCTADRSCSPKTKKTRLLKNSLKSKPKDVFFIFHILCHGVHSRQISYLWFDITWFNCIQFNYLSCALSDVMWLYWIRFDHVRFGSAQHDVDLFSFRFMTAAYVWTLFPLSSLLFLFWLIVSHSLTHSLARSLSVKQNAMPWTSQHMYSNNIFQSMTAL
jgi:hypothetical protein